MQAAQKDVPKIAYGRKLVHFLTGLALLILTYVVDRQILLILMLAGMLFSFATFKYRVFQALHKTPGASLGTLFYPLGIISAFLILKGHPPYFFRTALMVLTLADPIASIFGQIRPWNERILIWRDMKSFWGMTAFAITAWLVFLFFLPVRIHDNSAYLLLALLLAVACELISYRGSDNFTIPFGLAVFFVLSEVHDLNLWLLTALLLLMTLGSYLLFTWGVLTRHGSLMAWALGFYFIGILGFRWILPVLFFFISSVLFTRWHTWATKKERKSNRRNAWQVVANIIWAVLSSVLYLITRDQLFILLFISGVAAVTADTWASELGPLMNRRSLSLADFRMYPAGIIGGISLGGSIAAFLGSLSIATLSYFLFFGRTPPADVSQMMFPAIAFTPPSVMILMLSLAGFFACFADTLIGTFFEGRWLVSPRFQHASGNESFSPNDLVNMLGSATAPAFFLVLYLMCL